MSAVARAMAVEGLTDYVDVVERRLHDAVAWRAGVAADAACDTLRAGGKRLRPMLVYLGAPAAVRERPELAAAGSAVELVHMATLVHDDVLDQAPLRRGRPTVWHERGARVASAAGDHLFARAFAELTETGEMEAVDALARACLSLANGEIRQRAQTGDPSTTVEQYLERCTLKTGSLFAAAAVLGGILGGVSDADRELLWEFGVALGLAFQITDDILDCDGKPDTTGKPLGTDLLDGTVTLPLILAAQRAAQVAEVIRRGAGPADVLPTLALVARCGAVRDARREAEGHAERALDSLERVGERLDRRALRAVVDGAVDRRG